MPTARLLTKLVYLKLKRVLRGKKKGEKVYIAFIHAGIKLHKNINEICYFEKYLKV